MAIRQVPLWLVLAVILGISAFLRLVGLGYESLRIDEVALRLPSAFVGLATILFLGLVARWVGLASFSVTTMAILALSPFHVRYSQEAPAYALLLLLAVAAAWFLRRPFEASDRAWVNGAGFIVTTVLALYTHLLALSFLSVLLPPAEFKTGVDFTHGRSGPLISRA